MLCGGTLEKVLSLKWSSQSSWHLQEEIMFSGAMIYAVDNNACHKFVIMYIL